MTTNANRATHTPGPWTLKVVRDEPKDDASPRLAAWGVVQRPGTHSIETNLADARLIAAAPDMLVFVSYVADQDDEADGLRDAARALLARIDGKEG